MTALLEYPLRSDLPRYDNEEVLVGAVECVRCGGEVQLRATPSAWEEQEDGSLTVVECAPGMGWCCDLVYIDEGDGVYAYCERARPEIAW